MYGFCNIHHIWYGTDVLMNVGSFFTETQRHRMLYIYLKSIQVHESNEPTTTAQWNNSIQDTVRTTTLTPYNICIMSLKPMYIARVVIYFYTYISIQSSTLWLCFSSYLSWLSILCHSKECNLDGNEINQSKHMEIMKSITSNLHGNMRNALMLNKFIANHRMQYIVYCIRLMYYFIFTTNVGGRRFRIDLFIDDNSNSSFDLILNNLWITAHIERPGGKKHP